jgi:antitoxin CptB
MPGPAAQDADRRALGELRWRCRRGMRELDVLLERYVDERFRLAPSGEQEAFRQLLETQDPLLFAYCFGPEHPPAEFAALIERITANSLSRR